MICWWTYITGLHILLQPFVSDFSHCGHILVIQPVCQPNTYSTSDGAIKGKIREIHSLGNMNIIYKWNFFTLD